MALLNSFFLATDEQLRALGMLSGPSESLPRVLAMGLDAEHISLLHDIVHGWDPRQARGQPHVIPVPECIVERLAESDDEQLEEYSLAWASIKTWGAKQPAPDGVTALVKALAVLARQARAKGLPMYLWLSGPA